MKITGDEFGPLSVVDGNYDKTFRDDFLILYRLFGGAASEGGQFWTVQRHDGDESYRDALAVARRWNTLEDYTCLVVPKGVCMYEGIAAPHGGYPGGGLQVFIPQSISKPLFAFPKLFMARASSSDMEQWKSVVDTVGKAQSDIFNRWNKKRIERITSNSRNLALRGRHFRSLPSAVQRALRDPTTGNSTASKVVLPQGTYKLHEERIKHIDGSCQTLSLSVKTEFVKSTTRTYQSGRTTIVETTNYYNIVYIWS
ncbi:hypothetical protein OS493_024510 [Desmophyllum pertusum]|uniref:Uncharacterized protein n=1 Tax=Desmophyllum pertusum TaxID=174260 RepID=A0A9W9YDK6_9CNID|nr:hypothetical protein OS493_024510 [Desmophyllum pertusum]